MKKIIREKDKNIFKDHTLPTKKYPYLLTYNKYYKTPMNIRNNKSYHNKTHNKLRINANDTFHLFNPDEEYVTKLNFFNIGTKRDLAKKVTLYNLSTVTQFPSIIKKDSDNVESFKEKKRILNELKSKKTIFDKQNNAEGSKQTYVNRYENTFKESQLEKERKEIEKKMYKLKEMIKSLSIELSSTIKEIDNLKLDVEIMQNYRSYNLFNPSGISRIKKNENKNKENNNQSKNNDNENSITTPKNFRKSISKERESIDKDNKFRLEMKLLSNSEKINKIKQEMKMKIKELQEKKISLLEKIEVCENELQKFKEIHQNIKDELLVHYHRLLSEGKDTRKDGLSWIILAIWNLKSNVLMSYLPKFLDQNIILFLFEYSSLLKKIKETEKKIQELALKLKEHKENLKNSPNTMEDNLRNYFVEKITNNIVNNKENKEEKNNIKEEKEEGEKEEGEKEGDNNNEEEEEEEEEEEDNNNNKEENKLDGENLEEDEKEDTELNNSKNNKEDKNYKNKKSNTINGKNLRISGEIEEQNESEQSEKENNEEKEINDNDNLKEPEKEDKIYNEYNQKTKFVETFKTSLYNTNSEKIGTKTNNLFFEKNNFKKGNNNLKEDNFIKNKEKKRQKELININSMPINFSKSLFRKEDLYKNNKNKENEEKKIKLNDFKNIINKRQSYSFDYKTFQLFNEHKNMEKYYSQLKENAELLMKKELDRVSKSFYLYDYGAKYNIDQKTVISALVGEDSVRSEFIRQKKQEKEYFKTLRELRNGKMFQKK